MRTLLISDLHLGSRSGRDVLRAPAPLGRLLGELEHTERLVLLGDTLELVEARPLDALALATPVLRAIGAALGPDREVVVVPGNHDRLLIRDWLRVSAAGLALDSEIPPDAGPLLARVCALLAPARVTVRYPGLWLTDEIWATHGHYLDRHLMPTSAYGFARGLLGRLPSDGASPGAYEQRPSVTALEGPLTRWLPRGPAARADDLVAVLRRATMAGAGPSRRPASALVPRVLTRVLGAQMRRAAIPALARVVHRLGADERASAVIFGHVHRLGPRPGDDLAQWSGPTGSPRIYNTGSWIHEPLLLHRRAGPPHAYWPGGAVRVEGGEITVLSLLDELTTEQMRGLDRNAVIMPRCPPTPPTP